LSTRQHIDDPASADSGLHNHLAAMVGNGFSDNAGIFPVIILLDGRKNFPCISRIHDGDELSFIGNIEGIKSQKLANAGGFVFEGDFFFINTNADIGFAGDFI
jgi:hypothetical protein